MTNLTGVSVSGDFADFVPRFIDGTERFSSQAYITTDIYPARIVATLVTVTLVPATGPSVLSPNARHRDQLPA
jgi:hypothetical protein